MSPYFKPENLVIERDLQSADLAVSLIESGLRLEIAPHTGPADYSRYDRKTLILGRHRGSFLKPCPGTRGYLCCGLQIIHFGLGCSLDCSYCILQSYLDTEALVLFGNVDEGLEQVRGSLNQLEPKYKRYCTGEFTDSLLLEDVTGFGAVLVEIFSHHRNVVLELKTKTDNVDSLVGLEHRGRTVVSFSMNAPAIAGTEEPRAASLKKRILAAKKMVDEGYRIGFHFDPLIIHPDWKEGYAQTVAEIYDSIPAKSIAWISLGAFRFLPKLKEIVSQRHPRSKIMYEEFVLALDGKMRYLRPLRVEMYRHLLAEIQKADPKACVYLCMESPRVWLETFGFNPGPNGLIEMLDARV